MSGDYPLGFYFGQGMEIDKDGSLMIHDKKLDGLKKKITDPKNKATKTYSPYTDSSEKTIHSQNDQEKSKPD
jgi:hypothetical protein